MPSIQKIIPCLWFDDEAEDATKFYTSIFDHSKITRITRYGEAGYEIHKRPKGSVMTVEFELDGNQFTALNGGPVFQFNEALSLQVMCDTQDEVDYFWNRLSDGGDEKAQQCGWLKDKFGLSWQVIPTEMNDLMSSADSEKSERVMESMLKMKKLDIEELRRAYKGEAQLL